MNRLPENWQNALAIVAHPDDLEYGAASAIAKWTSQGKRVVYVMVSRGEAGIDGMDPSEVGPAADAGRDQQRSGLPASIPLSFWTTLTG